MNKYIHIGYPKNFSTSLQRDYFAKHPSISHLGVGVDSNIGYQDSFVEKTCEVYLKTCKYFKYKTIEKDIVSHFKKVFESTDSKYKTTGVSLEHFSFSFSYDSLSTQEKAERLRAIFGKNTKIIMIIRNQFDLIKSLYKEYVRNGFFGDFKEFMKLTYKYQDRNFVYDFRFDLVYSTYAKLFGKENIGVFFFEDYRDKEGLIISDDNNVKLFSDLNNFLSIENIKMDFNHFNESLPANKILINAKKNKQKRHDFGNQLLDISEKHRIKAYLEEDLGIYELETETYSDVLVKREVINDTLKDDQTKPLSFEINNRTINQLKSFYEEGNSLLKNKLGKNLPKSYHNLKM